MSNIIDIIKYIKRGTYKDLKYLLLCSLEFDSKSEMSFFQQIKEKKNGIRYKEVFKTLIKELKKQDYLFLLKWFIDKMIVYNIESYHFQSLYTIAACTLEDQFGFNSIDEIKAESTKQIKKICQSLEDDVVIKQGMNKTIKSSISIKKFSQNEKINSFDGKKAKIKKEISQNEIEIIDWIKKFKSEYLGSLKFNSKEIIKENNIQDFLNGLKYLWNNLNYQEYIKRNIFFQFFHIRLFGEKISIVEPDEISYLKKSNSDKKYFISHYIEKKQRFLKKIHHFEWIPKDDYLLQLLSGNLYHQCVKYNILESLCFNVEKNIHIFSFLIGLLIGSEEIIRIIEADEMNYHLAKKILFVNQKENSVIFYGIFS